MVPDVRVQKEARPGKKDCHSDLLLNSRALALSCLLNKPSTHKHAEWSGKSSLTLVKEVTSRVEMASCHFPCQGDICHNLLSCFTWRGGEGEGRRGTERAFTPSGLTLLHVTASLSLLRLIQKGIYFSFGLWSLSFGRDERSILRCFYFFSKILPPFLVSYNECLVYYINHSICLGKAVLHL